MKKSRVAPVVVLAFLLSVLPASLVSAAPREGGGGRDRIVKIIRQIIRALVPATNDDVFGPPKPGPTP